MRISSPIEEERNCAYLDKIHNFVLEQHLKKVLFVYISKSTTLCLLHALMTIKEIKGEVYYGIFDFFEDLDKLAEYISQFDASIWAYYITLHVFRI